MKKLLLASVFALASVPALADTFEADSYTQPGITRTITNPLNPTETISVGEIQLHQNIPAKDLLVWCLDLNDLLNVPYTFQVNTFQAGDIRPGIQPLDASQVRQIASLMLNGLSLGGVEANAATQLAIWKVEYGNALTFTGLSAPLTTALGLALADSVAGGILDCANCALTVLTDAPVAPNQALGFAVAVPAPLVGAGLPGLLAACFGLFGLNKLRRRRNGGDLPTVA